MGTIQHHAIVATTWDDDVFLAMLEWIRNRTEDTRKLFKVGEGWMNGYSTVVLIPDGSKEGWPESGRGDNLRDFFIDRLKEDDHRWDWVEVTYGELGHGLTRRGG
jgi:hypothetical protein